MIASCVEVALLSAVMMVALLRMKPASPLTPLELSSLARAAESMVKFAEALRRLTLSTQQAAESMVRFGQMWRGRSSDA